MDHVEFADLRQGLSITKRQLSHLLGVSLKSVRNYERGRKAIPANVAQQLLSLRSMKQGMDRHGNSNLRETGCSSEQRLSCPAWELRIGHVSWVIDASVYHGISPNSWADKMPSCRNCSMLHGLA